MRPRHRILALGLLAAGLAAVLVLARGSGRDALEGHPPDPADSPAAAQQRSRQARSDAAEKDRSSADRSDPGAEAQPHPDAAADLAAGSTPQREDGRRAASDDLETRGAQPIFLDRLEAGQDVPTVALSGRDPLGPRELVAWRIKDGRAAILARGESDADGELQFPPVVAPGDGLEVVVTDADSLPGLPGASEARSLPPRRPEPPQADLLAAEAEEYLVRILPSEATGEVLLADSQGAVFARYELPPNPSLAARVFDVTVTAPGEGGSILLAHQFGDGRRSDWRVLPLIPDAPVGGGAGEGAPRFTGSFSAQRGR